MMYLTEDQLAVLCVLSDGQAWRPAAIARALDEHSSGYTANILHTLKAPGVGLVESEYHKTKDVNDWGKYRITNKGDAELYIRQEPQLELLDGRYIV